jgi:hypothetical protein
MEILRKKLFALLLLVATATSVFSQTNQEALETAFEQSYAYEKNGAFSEAMDPLKKVYNESTCVWVGSTTTPDFSMNRLSFTLMHKS